MYLYFSQSLEEASNSVGLYLNEKKTEFYNKCHDNSICQIKTLNGSFLKEVDDYKYLGSYISSSEKDFLTRRAMAWSACNDMHRIWTSQIKTEIKVKLFRATMRAKNISWKHHPSLATIYGNLPRVSSLVRMRRVQFAGHCYRAESEIISSLLLWKPRSNTRGRKLSYPDVISRDTSIRSENLGNAMMD